MYVFVFRMSDFEEVGIKLIVVSLDDVESLKRLIDVYEEGFFILLVFDEFLVMFKVFCVFDDFEEMLFYGMFFIDEKGMIWW